MVNLSVISRWEGSIATTTSSLVVCKLNHEKDVNSISDTANRNNDQAQGLPNLTEFCPKTSRTNRRCPTIARPGTPSSFNLASHATDVLVTITADIYNYNEQPLQVHQERQAAAYQHQGAETAVFSQRKLRDCVRLVGVEIDPATINGSSDSTAPCGLRHARTLIACQHGRRPPPLSQLWPIQHDPPARLSRSSRPRASSSCGSSPGPLTRTRRSSSTFKRNRANLIEAEITPGKPDVNNINKSDKAQAEIAPIMGLLSAVIYQRIRRSRARIVSASYPSLPSSIPARAYCKILLLSTTNSCVFFPVLTLLNGILSFYPNIIQHFHLWLHP